jgi:hypothetical protein
MIYTLANDESTAITPRGIHSGMDITIQNINTSGYIYIDTVDTVSSESYGFRLPAGAAFSVELNGKDDLYIIASANGLQAAVLIVGLE